MRNTLKHLTLLTRMKDDGLLPALTGSFSEDAIEQACGQVETLQLQKRLHIRKTKRIQEELIRVPNFAALYGVLCGQEIGDEEIASVLESADGYGEKLTAYPQEQVLAVMKLELLPSLRFEYLKYYFPFVMYEEEEQVILDNLQTFPIAEWKGLSMLTEHQRDMMRQPFLGSYLFFWHQNERKALELLEQNRPLQRVCILLYRYGVRLFLSVERLKDLRWMKMTDVGKFRRLLAVFEYDAEDLSAFFDLWLDNHAGQYDLNWFISQPHPLSKERREEILCNQLSYLNALYAGRLHLDFNAVRQFQFSILIYAVEHRKKHFLELVDQNSEVFLSLGRYSLLFEPGFCEHCNINSLTLKNLKASDSVNRNDSFFTLLEEGQQYTFEEMYQLWHQKEVTVMKILQTTDLKKYYGTEPNITRALDGVNFSVEEGEFVAVVGTSGSGKSTLLHMMGGLDTPTSGSVMVRDKELAKMNDEQLTIFRRRNIGFIFQNYNLVPILNVHENIVLPVELDGDTVDQKFMADVVSMLGLEDKLKNMPNNLSGGQQQRVAIARALVSKPAIVLADEPTGNLDSRTSADVLGLLQRTSREFNQTLVMITHNDAIAQLADRIVRIEDGKIVG